MKNNLLKSVAAAATASALLFSTVTSFADEPSATTVTTYSDGTVSVSSTIKNVENGTMVTYLASKNGTVEKNSDILYIGQQTSTGSDITFSYNLPSSVTATAGNVLAKVKYGASDEDTAKKLNSDASTEVKYGTLTIVKNNCSIKVNGATLDENATPNVGNGDEIVVGIEPTTGYEIKEVYLNGDADENAPTSKQVSVKYSDANMELVVICGAVSDESNPTVVGVRSYTEADKKMVGLLCSKSAPTDSTVTFGVVAEKTNGEGYVMDSREEGNFYAATVGDGSYYAVELFSNEDGLKLIPAYKDGQTIHVFVDGGTTEYTK